MILLSRYEYNPKTDLIGTGGFSRVYRAFDKKLNRAVALKIYKTSEISDRYNPIAEIQRVADLDHPNICRYLDIDEIEHENSFGEREQIQVCVMELLDGGSIEKYFHTHRDPLVLRKLIMDVLQGLTYLHRKGIIHRDIKPANILIKQTDIGPVAKITDFGISKMSDATNNSSSSALIVSIPYLAPEQLNPEKYGIDGKIAFNLDLWTLGVAVYEVITGNSLFKTSEKDTSEETMMNIQSTALPEKIKDIHQPFRALVTECLVRDAKLRVKSADALMPVLLADYPEEDKPVEKMDVAVVEETLRPDEPVSGDDTQVLPKPIFQPGVGVTGTEDHTMLLPKPIADERVSGDDTRILPRVHSMESGPEDQTMILNPQGAAKKQEAISNADETKILSSSGRPPDESRRKPPPTEDETKILYDSVPDTHTTGLFQRKEGPLLLFNRYAYVPSNDLIGRGGFSRVYKAYDQKLNRWVALKVYKTGEFSDRYSPISEIRRVINLDHPNICRYLDIEEIEKENHFGENEKIQVCVMELLDSGNFAEYYRSNKDPEVLRKLIRDILHGLSYLHKNAIIHRDIKPANILIKKTIEGPVAKITDFGISKISDSVNNNSSSALIVSIPYMAPEQLNPKKYGINEKIAYNLDLWSLGVTIYEVITGNVLFKNSEQDNSEQIMTNIMAPELPKKIDELPEPFRNVVAHCIIKDANARAKKADELLVLLDGNASTSPWQNPAAQNPDPATAGVLGNPLVISDTRKKTPERASKKGRTDEIPVSVKEPDPKRKPPISFNYLQVAIGIGIIFVVMIIFLFIRSSRTESLIKPDEPGKTTLPAVVKNTPDAADSVRKAELPLPVAPITKDKERQAETVNPKAVVAHKADHPAEKKKPQAPVDQSRESKSTVPTAQNQEPKTQAPPVANGSQKYILELTTTQTCTIKLNSMDIGILETGKTMKVYLKPGKYLLQATSTSNPSAVYTGNLQVDQENINEVGKLKIRL